jgi:iron complex outermembrane recepter protein
MKTGTVGLSVMLAAAALPAAAEQPYALDTIVVTGTRQANAVRDLAGNTAVIDDEAIRFNAPNRPTEILNQVPGVDIQQGSGEEHLTAIRSPVLTSGAGAGSFLFLEDGVPLRAAGFGNINGLFEANVEQAGSIEVVRGPGSALYGSNAVHGLINVIPRAPGQAFGGDATLTLAPYAGRRLLSSVSAEGARVSAQANHEGGWRDHTRLDEQKFILRHGWTGANDTITSTLSGQNLDQDTGGFITGANAYRDRSLAKTNANPEAYRQARSVRGMVRWQHDLSNSLQLSVTPYVRHTEMEFLMHFVPSKATETNAHDSVGMQTALYKSLAGGHSVILGTDLEYTDGSLTEIQTAATTGTYVKGTHYDYDVQATVIAPYVHTEWQVLDKTRLTAGIRAEGTFYDYTNNTAADTFGRFLRPASRNDDFTTVTPKLGVVQQWSPQLASYVNLSRGARAPQTTDLYRLESRQQVGDTKPESLDSAEMGTRGTMGEVRFDVAAFWMYKRHFFYRDVDGFNVSNGETEHKGIELAASSPLPMGFDVGVSATYARHTYAFSRPATAQITEAVTKGNDVDTAPRVLSNIRLGYTWFTGYRAELEYVHVGKYYTDAANLHTYPGHDLFNLRAEAKVNPALSLQAKLLNVTNEAYADRADYANGTDRYFPGMGRTAMAGVTVRF